VTLDADRVDVFRALATLEVEGARGPPMAIDVCASVLGHALEVVWPGGGGQVSEVEFAPVLVGQSRSMKLLVVNNGPEEASFRVAVDRQFRRARPGESEGDLFDPAEGLVQGGAGAGDAGEGIVSLGPGLRDVTVTPDEATIPSLGQQELTVTFRPVERKKPVAFKAQARKVLGLSQRALAAGRTLSLSSTGGGALGDETSGGMDPGLGLGVGHGESKGNGEDRMGDAQGTTGVGVDALPEDLAAFVPPPLSEQVLQEILLLSTTTKQRLLMPVRGTLVRPALELSHKDIFFGPCASGGRRDVEVQLRNPSDASPMQWTAIAPAHYAIRPRKGVLKPLEAAKVLVTFMPRSLGVHRQRMHVSGAGGLVDLEVRLEGHAVEQPGPGERVLRSKGAGAPQEDHRAQLHLVPGDRESAQRALKAIPGYRGTVLPT